MEIKINNLDDMCALMCDNRIPRKQEIEQILVDYGVAFTDALAERLDRYMEEEMSDFWQREKVDNPQGKGIEDLILSEDDIEHLKENGQLYTTVGEYSIVISLEGKT